MELFLDTANILEIKEAEDLGILTGVTTNPTILLKEKRDRKEIIVDILKNIKGIVFVQTVGDSFQEIMKDAEEILAYGEDRIGIKIPVTKEGIKAINTLKGEGIKILATAVFSPQQALMAALAGADYIAPYINRMESNGIDSEKVIKDIRSLYDLQGVNTKILAASFKNVHQLTRTLMAGSHTATISSELFNSLFKSSLTENSVKKFNEDGKEIKKYGY